MKNCTIKFTMSYTDTHETIENFWVCDQCKHTNPEHQWPCEQCEYPVKLSGDILTNIDFDMSVGLEGGRKPWICFHCTHANDQMLIKCELCKGRRKLDSMASRREILDQLFQKSGCSLPAEAELTEKQVLRLLSSVVKTKNDYQLTDLEENPMGSKVIVSKTKDISGVLFRVWAPNATR